MAASMNVTTFEFKSKTIDDLQEEFKTKLHNFTSNVKSIMCTSTPEEANESFTSAIDFLTQTFPDAPDSVKAETMDKISQLAMKVEDLEKANKIILETVESLAASRKALKSQVDELSKKVKVQQRHIYGLRRLQKTFKCGQATASSAPNRHGPPPPTSAASAPKSPGPSPPTASSSSAPKPPGPPPSASSSSESKSPQGLRERTNFSCRFPGDKFKPDIQDLRLLPGNLIVLVDQSNQSLKLVTSEGQKLDQRNVKPDPRRLTVMDITSRHEWVIALTLPQSRNIGFLSVTHAGITHQRLMVTSKSYNAIAALDPKSLAVGYSSGPGIDLLNLSGQVLRQISDTFNPHWMVVSSNYLVMSTRSDHLVKLNVIHGAVVYQIRVDQLLYPRGVTCHQDGSCFTSDRDARTLTLVQADGKKISKVWTHPIGEDKRNRLWGVSHLDNTVTCCTKEGSVFVLDVL